MGRQRFSWYDFTGMVSSVVLDRLRRRHRGRKRSRQGIAEDPDSILNRVTDEWDEEKGYPPPRASEPPKESKGDWPDPRHLTPVEIARLIENARRSGQKRRRVVKKKKSALLKKERRSSLWHNKKKAKQRHAYVVRAPKISKRNKIHFN